MTPEKGQNLTCDMVLGILLQFIGSSIAQARAADKITVINWTLWLLKMADMERNTVVKTQPGAGTRLDRKIWHGVMNALK